MSLGKISLDMHHDTIIMSPENEGFEMGPGHYGWDKRFYENSKEGLKSFLNDYVYGIYPLLYIEERRFFTDEEAEKHDMVYHNALNRVIWSDNPDVSFVPKYDTKTKSELYSHKFKLTKEKDNWHSVAVPGIKGEVSRYLSNMVKGTKKELVISKIHMVHTKYYSMNSKEVQIEVTLVDKKQLKEVRAKIKAEEMAAQAAKEAAEKKAKEDAVAAKKAAEELILKTEFGKNIIKRTYDYDMIVRWVTEGKLTEKFLNAQSISDLIPDEMLKNKDYLRISDILKKSDILYRGNNKSLLASLDLVKARKLASQQGAKIKDEAKRNSRKEAARAIGAGWLAVYF